MRTYEEIDTETRLRILSLIVDMFTSKDTSIKSTDDLIAIAEIFYAFATKGKTN